MDDDGKTIAAVGKALNAFKYNVFSLKILGTLLNGTPNDGWRTASSYKWRKYSWSSVLSESRLAMSLVLFQLRCVRQVGEEERMTQALIAIRPICHHD